MCRDAHTELRQTEDDPQGGATDSGVGAAAEGEMAPLMAAGGQRQPSSLVAHATGALYGVVSLLLLLPVTLGYASLMLGSVGLDNPQLLSRVASLMFLANGTFALTYAALDRGTHASIGSVQDPGVMFLAAVVQSLASACATAPECSTEVSSTAIIMIAGGATAITALAFLLLSFMPRLVQLVTYIPLPVVGGFLASIGAFILQGGLSLSLEPVDLPKGAMDSAGAASGWVAAAYSLVAEENRLPAVLSLGYGVALSIVVRISSHPAVLPCAMALPVPIFYAVVAMSPLSFDEPWSENMFFSDSTLSDGTPNNTTVEDVGIFPPLVVGVAQNKLPIAQAAALIASSSGLPGLLANMVAAVCVSTLLLNTLGVETSLGLSFDYREELRLLASSNMISALAGGVPGARNYTLTVLTHTGLSAVGNTKSRAGAVTCGLLFVAMYLLDLPLHTGVPRWAFSGVLLFVGVDLLLAWLFTARSSMGRSDFGVVWLSFLAIQLLGINAGMAISVLVSIVAFIVQYSRVAVISRAPVRRANRFRLASERSALIKADAAILRYRVAGVLFFATARQLLAVIGAELDRIEAAVAAQAEARALAGGDTQPKGLRKRRLRGGARSARVSAETDGGAAADANSGSPSSVAGSAVVPAKFVLLDCGELQGIDASATQTFLRLRRMLNARGCVLVMCALPGQVWQLLRREGVLPDDSAVDSEEPLAVALRDYDAAAEWCEDRLLLSLGVGSTARPTDSHTSQASSSIVSSSHVTPGLPGDDESKAIEGADGESAQLSDLQPCPEVVESFSGYLSPPDVAKLFREYSIERHFEAGDVVFAEGEAAHSIFVVTDGHVALVRTVAAQAADEDRRRSIFSFNRSSPSVASRSRLQSVTPGGIVGDIDLILDEPRSFGCEATEHAVLRELSRDSIERMKAEAPHLFSAMTALQLRDMCAHIKDVSFWMRYGGRDGRAAQPGSL